MYYQVTFWYELDKFIYTPDDEKHAIDHWDAITDCVKDFKQYLATKLTNFELLDWDFDEQNEFLYLYFYTDTDLTNNNIEAVIFGDKKVFETSTEQSFYYGEVHDYDYYEEPYQDMADIEIEIVVSKPEITAKSDNEDDEMPLEESSQKLQESSVIKQEVELSPDELLQWGWDNNGDHSVFYVKKLHIIDSAKSLAEEEFVKTYSTETAAKKAFNSYLKETPVTENIKKDAGDVEQGVEVFNHAMGADVSESFWQNYPARYKVYYDIHTNSVLEGGSDDLAEAEEIAKACIERLSENPWEDKEDIESAIDSVMIYDTLEDLDVTTSDVEKMKTLFVD